MIPNFPKFKKIELTDKKDIEKFTSEFPPYSDFNFTSFWVWDINRERMLSNLNGNLVVCFTDYLTGELFFSFFGTNKIEQTIRSIIDFAKKTKVSPVLRFISEEIAKNLPNSDFCIEEDRDNFDYIFSTSQLSNFEGAKYKTKRHEVNKFLALYSNVVFESENLTNQILHGHIINLLQKWTVKKELNSGTENLDFESEKKALYRILQMENENVLIFTCFINNNLVGFEIDEILPYKYAIAHFSKVDPLYKGVNVFLNMKLSQYLKNIGIEFCNWEQDLGIENLRKSKMSYHPINLLKKYKVSIVDK